MDVRQRKSSVNTGGWLKRSLKVSLIGIVVLTVLFALNQWHISRFFPIRTVQVYGVNRVNPKDVESLAKPFLNEGFFAVNVEFIRDRLMQLPWVADLFVKRVWPDQVDIILTERKPVARWNQTSLLSDNGELFTPDAASIPGNLPSFYGPQGQQVFMFRYFQDINRLLIPLHVKMSALELTPHFTWRLTLDNGIIMQVGYKDILTQLSHFVKVYPKIIGMHEADVDYVDLRYSNGVAVKWKTTSNKQSV